MLGNYQQVLYHLEFGRISGDMPYFDQGSQVPYVPSTAQLHIRNTVLGRIECEEEESWPVLTSPH